MTTRTRTEQNVQRSEGKEYKMVGVRVWRAGFTSGGGRGDGQPDAEGQTQRQAGTNDELRKGEMVHVVWRVKVWG